MELLKDTPFEVAWLTWQARPQTTCLTVVVKGAFDIVASGECKIDPEQELLAGDLHYDDDTERSVRCESDFAAIKPRGECLVVGSCFSPGGRPTEILLAAFKIGPVVKKMAIIGDRHFKGFLSGQTKPVPFCEMPLCWERSFGGPRSRINPVGLGLGKSVVDGKAVIRLPNIEDPTNLIRGKRDRPTPIGSFPVPRSWPSRACLVGTCDARWTRTRWPWQPRDFQIEHHCAAPVDQRIDGFFRGDEEITLVNLHREIPKARFRLPGIGIRAFLHEAEGEIVRPLMPELDTITVDTDLGKVLCLWRAVTEVPSESLEEFSHLFVIHEAHQTECSEAEYREWFEQRKVEVEAEGLAFEAAPVPEQDGIRASQLGRAPVATSDRDAGERQSHLSSIPSTLLRKASVLPEPVPLSSPVMAQVTENAFDEGSVWIDAVLEESKDAGGEEPLDLPLPVKVEEPARVSPPMAEGNIAEPTMTFEKFQEQSDQQRRPDRVEPRAEPVGTVVLPAAQVLAAKNESNKKSDGDEPVQTVVLAAAQLGLDAAAAGTSPTERPLDQTVCLPDAGSALQAVEKPPTERALDQTVCLPDAGREHLPEQEVSAEAEETPFVEPTITFDVFTKMQNQLDGAEPTEPTRAFEPLKTMIVQSGAGQSDSAPETDAPQKLSLDQTIRMPASPSEAEPTAAPAPPKMVEPAGEAPGKPMTSDDEYASVAFTFNAVDESARALLAALEADEGRDEGPALEVKASWVRVSTDEDIDLESDELGWTISEESLFALAQEESFLEQPTGESATSRDDLPEWVDDKPTEVDSRPDDLATVVGEQPAEAAREKRSRVDVESVLFMRSSDLLNALALDDEEAEDGEEVGEAADPQGKESVVFLRSSELAQVFGGTEFDELFADDPVESTAPLEAGLERKALTPAPPAYLGRQPTEDDQPATRTPDIEPLTAEDASRDLTDTQQEQRARLEAALTAGTSCAGWILEDADLTDMDLSGADLRDAVLARADLAGAKLDDARLDGAVLVSANLTGASLRNASLREAYLIEARGAELRFEGVALDDANATDASFPGALFHECTATYLDLNGANLVGARFEKTSLDHADMSGAMLDDAFFVECSLRELDLSGGTSAKRVKMDECELAGLRASNQCDLSDGSFVKASIVGGRFSDSNLDRANFSFSDLDAADFSGATLSKAKLLGCKLRGACFDRAHLTAALLGKSDLHQARFERARLTYTDLRGCNLYGAEFLGAVIDGTLLELACLKGTKLA